MGVMLQAFYWDCPKAEEREHQWWAFIESKLPSIAQAGFTALWLPPANKAASWKSMGYDPYDYYDLGEFDQKGGVPTWFGSKAELVELIQSAHAAGLQVYADLVFNHNSGADSSRTESDRRSVALDAVRAEEQQVPARLEMFSSMPVRDLGRRNIR